MPMAQSAAQVDSAPLVTLIHAAGPGRLRLRVRGLYRSDRLKNELESALSAHALIEAANANSLTGNLLVRFPPDRDQLKILDEVEKTIRLCSWETPLPATQPKPAQTRPKPKSASRGRWFRLGSANPKSTDTAAPFQPMPTHDWHRLDTQETLARLKTSLDGLPADEAGRRLQLYGPNRLAENKRRSAIEIFAEQLANPAMAMLGVSAVVSIATGGLIDAAVIVSAVLLNAVIGYVTESSSERTINALGSMTPTHAHVIRDGKPVDVPMEDIVVGDLLLLTPGTYIPADASLLNSSRLTVDESALTGESLPVGKHWDFIAGEGHTLGRPQEHAAHGHHRHWRQWPGGGRGDRPEHGNRHHPIIVGEVKTPDTLLQRQLDESKHTELATLAASFA